eukprot:scaffold17709_cov81-Phaeocystis_antarctica.AAC.3
MPTPRPTTHPLLGPASAHCPPQTADGSLGRRHRASAERSTAARCRGQPGEPACPPARRAAAAVPSPRCRTPKPPPTSGTRGRTQFRLQRRQRKAQRCRPRCSTALAPPPGPMAATPPCPQPPNVHCSAPPPLPRQSRCAPQTCRFQAAHTPPKPRHPPPAPAAAGRTRRSAPRPPQRRRSRQSMPRAPSPGSQRQGK